MEENKLLKTDEDFRGEVKAKRGNRWHKFVSYFLRILLLLFISISVSGVIVFWQWTRDAPKFDVAKLLDPLPSKIYDRNGELYTTLGVETRDYITFDNIPQTVIDALLAIEDRRFYDHYGFDIIRLSKVMLTNFSTSSLQGASTITQQIIKLSLLTPEQTYKRKAQELYLASKLENSLSKNQILEIYFNKINMGDGIYGIGTAARYYFDKSLDELGLSEIAFLVGLPRNPSGYNVFNFPERANERKNIVLNVMHKNGIITAEELEAEKSVDIATLASRDGIERGDTRRTNAFIDQVLKEMNSEGITDVFSGGYSLYTTVDPSKQDFVEHLLETNDIIDYPDDDIQSGIVVLDTSSSEVLAIGGWRKSDVARGFNYATGLTVRQPGSTIKPLLVYAPAVEYKYNSSYWLIKDEPHKYSDGTPVNNATLTFSGNVSMRTALKDSLNVPAVKTIQEIGVEKSHQFLNNLGIDLGKPLNETVALGGSKESPSPYKLAGAYASLGNNGVYTPAHTVTKIQTRDGLLQVLAPEGVGAMRPSTAYIITDVLKDVPLTGTGRRGYVEGLPVAAKTGTTSYESAQKENLGLSNSEVPDSWYVGYTTNFTIAVWTGYEQQNRPLNTSLQGIPADTFREIMRFSSEDVETLDFQMPDDISRVSIISGTFPARPATSSTSGSDIISELFPRRASEIGSQGDSGQNSGEFKETIRRDAENKLGEGGGSGFFSR